MYESYPCAHNLLIVNRTIESYSFFMYGVTRGHILPNRK